MDCLLAVEPLKGDPMMIYKYWLIACVAFFILEILPPPTHFLFRLHGLRIARRGDRCRLFYMPSGCRGLYLSSFFLSR